MAANGDKPRISPLLHNGAALLKSVFTFYQG